MEGKRGREYLYRAEALNTLMLLAKCILLRQQTPKRAREGVGQGGKHNDT